MEDKNNSQIETAEEMEAEKGHLVEVKEEQVREDVLKEYGFDPETDAEKIEKAVKREVAHRKSLSTAIGQKRAWREKATGNGKGNSPAPDNTGKDKGLSQEDVDRRVSETLEKRDLEALDYPDEIKASIAKLAKVEGISIKKALGDPYIVAKIEAHNKIKNANDASISRNNRQGGGSSGGDDLVPPDVDMSTKEGQAAYDKWKSDMVKKGY